MRITQQYAESIRCKLPSGAIDRTGTTRGRLTFLWPTTERMLTVIKWVARCSCGNYTLVARTTRSCGCLNTKDRYWSSKAVLSEAAVFAIRNSDKPGIQLAAEYGVSNSTISNVRCGRRYAGVTHE